MREQTNISVLLYQTLTRIGENRNSHIFVHKLNMTLLSEARFDSGFVPVPVKIYDVSALSLAVPCDLDFVSYVM